MEWIGAALSIIKMTMGLLIKTPTEQLGDVSKNLSRMISEMRDGVEELKENPGDTSSLEDVINRNRSKFK